MVKRKNEGPEVRPSDKVKKCLFGKADEHDKEEERRRVQQETSANLEKMKVKYNYDFIEEKHLNFPNTQYTVANVIEESNEKDLNTETASVSVGDAGVQVPSKRLITTPNKQCLGKNESSKSNSLNGTVSEETRNGESNKALLDSKTQS